MEGKAVNERPADKRYETPPMIVKPLARILFAPASSLIGHSGASPRRSQQSGGPLL
jgi:hypothetical protein